MGWLVRGSIQEHRLLSKTSRWARRPTDLTTYLWGKGRWDASGAVDPGNRLRGAATRISSIKKIFGLNRFKNVDRNSKKLLGERVWFLDASAKLRRATFSFITSVRPSARNNSATTGRIFMKFDIWILYENLSSKFKFHENLTIITGTLHDRYRLFIISRSVLLRMRKFSSKVVGKIKTHILCPKTFIVNCAVCEIMLKNIVQPGRTHDNKAHALCMLDN